MVYCVTIHQFKKNIQAEVAHIFNPRMWVTETGVSLLVWGQHGLQNNFQKAMTTQTIALISLNVCVYLFLFVYVFWTHSF